MRNFLLVLISMFFVGQLSAQRIYGTIKDESGQILPFSSVVIKSTTRGTSANEYANYSISVQPGKYTILCQRIGYETVEKTVEVQSDAEVNFVLAVQKLNLETVVVKTGGEDPAYAIIRNAIKKRAGYAREVDAFSCEMYSKNLIKMRQVPDKILGQKVEKEDMKLDSTGKGIVHLSETISELNFQKPDKLKMHVRSSRVSGSNSYGFSFPTFISLYQNNVTVFSSQLNPRGFVSPIADGAIGFYKFTFLGSYFENGKEINTIRVTPRRNYEPLFTGIINIIEDEWRVHSFDLMLTQKSQLELLDTLQITQLYVPVTPEIWRVKNQLLHFNIKMFGFDAIGNFLNVYSEYDVNPEFGKKFFDRVILAYDTGSNKKTQQYWDSIRPVPLEDEELRDYQVKDSLFIIERDSALSRSAIDSLRKRQGKIKPTQFLVSGVHRNHYSKTAPFSWDIDGLLFNTEYNPAEKIATNLTGSIRFRMRKLGYNMEIKPGIRYGFGNGHLNAWSHLILSSVQNDPDKKYRQQSFAISGGKRVTEFNKESGISPFVNTISVLFYGKNHIKTYENYYGLFNFGKKFESGLALNANLLYEDRIPLRNISKFTFSKEDSIYITPNFPIEKITADENIPHQAFILTLGMQFKPGQRYIQYPRRKVPIGSKYPLFSIEYSKGIGDFLGSDVDFDKWDFNISDDKNFKLAGLLKYKIGTGGFLNAKHVPIADYKHFNGNQTVSASAYVNSFQLAPYYFNSTTASLYGYAHLEHHFNGLFTNKIPLFNRLKWNLVGGGNAFYVNQESNYVELFVGLENIFKIFRVDFVAAFENGQQAVTGIRIGSGGIIGGGITGSLNSANMKGNYTGKIF